ncbi:glutathione S-transferase family protein [Oscillatoria sp. FACHB-1407]|uniref:glutathione S-transferase family protein n=1 Tax=Oscillatoria sp. FACHB-1407 TaxID=2692847 RepID=UPI0016865293|nr:glutathione S-transferase family protein [Oscillatoria sp. FACHB-1407]MBD2461173.1 glutathione S-transferase family protein [Oscillatoria sp. FACHB-1407]
MDKTLQQPDSTSIKLYYARPSLYARPIWLALLEKHLPFELVPVNLGGEQFEAEFLALNPFGHIPVLIDNGFRVIESQAILDYLEAKYPTRSLLPHDPESLANVRMVQFVTLNELLPGVVGLLIHNADTPDVQYAQFRIANTLNFLESMLSDAADHPFIAGEHLTLAEIVAGTLVPILPHLGISLTPYPKLHAWSERLLARPSWQAIQLSPEEWNSFTRHMKVIPKVWQRRRRQRIQQLQPV